MESDSLSTSVTEPEPGGESVSSSEDSSVLVTALEPDYILEPATLPVGCNTELLRAQSNLRGEPATASSTDSRSDDAVTAVQASEPTIHKWRAVPDSDSSDDVKTAIELYVPSDRDLMLLDLPASRRPPNANASINEEEVTRPLEGDYCPVRGMLSDRHLAFGGHNDDDSNESTPSNIFVTAFNVLKWTARLCYIVCCPPVPKKVIEKSVFFPPKRGRYYFLIGGPAENRQAFVAADKAYDQEDLTMCLTCFADKRYIGTVIMDQVLRLKINIILTPTNRYLAVAHARCYRSVVEQQQSPRVILFSQANSSDLGTCMLISPNFVDIADRFACDVVAYDYCGFGVSTGKSSEAAVYSSIETVFAFITETLGYQPEQVILFGFSLGTAASIHMASLQQNVGGMVLLAPFTSILRVVGNPNAEKTCCFDQFSSYDKVGSVRTRTLICHGTGDKLVAKSHGEALHGLLPNACEPFWAENVTHQRIYLDRSMWDRVHQFFDDDLRVMDAWIGRATFHRSYAVTSQPLPNIS